MTERPPPATEGSPDVADVATPTSEPAKDSAATTLVKLATAQYNFGVSDAGEPFAVPKVEPRVVRQLRGGKTSLRAQLARTYFNATGKAAPQQALADALLVIEGAAQDTDEQPLHMRVARHDGALWLDLGDPKGRAARITEDGWTIQNQAPVLFKRTVLTSPLPEPTHGGNLDELWSWLNVTQEDRPLVAAWLIAALRPDIPHPVLHLSGEQGSGKTTAEKVLVSVLDPSPVPARKPPRDADSWVTAATGSWIVGLDNLTDVPGWLSDSLCRAVTGEGDVRRQLYTDGSLVVFAFRRCIAITGIDLGALNGDLADRLLPIHLDNIGEDKRREESELWPGWEDAHPRILGAVLDLAAGVEQVLPSVRPAGKPRMADYARVLAAVDKVLGTNGLARYRAGQGTLATESLTADAFIVALAKVVAGRKFTGTAARLLDEVTPTADNWYPPKGWPANARAVTQKLRRQAPVMRKAGWTVDDDDRNKNGVACWTVTPPPSRPEMARNPDPPDPPHPPHDQLAGQAGQAGQEYGPSQDVTDDLSWAECRMCGELLDEVHAQVGTHPLCDPVGSPA